MNGEGNMTQMEILKTLADNAGDLIYVYEFLPKRGFSYVSPSALAITGYTPEEHYADPDLGMKIIHPADKELLSDMIAGRQEIKQKTLLRWIKKDGNVIWIEQTNVPEYDGERGLKAVIGIAKDVTRHHDVSASIGGQFSLTRALFDNARDGLLIINSEHRVIEANQEICRMLGYDMKEITRLYTWDFEAKMTKEDVIRSFSLSQGIDTTFESVHRRSDGTTYPVEVSARTFRFEGQNVVFCSCRDITGRKRIEENLEEQKTQFRNLFQHLADAVFIADIQTGIVVDANESACSLMQMPIEKIIGLHQSQLHPEEIADTAKEQFEQHNAELESNPIGKPLEMTVKRSDGVIVPVEIVTGKLDSYKGRKCMMGAFRDISLRKNAEELARKKELEYSELIENLKDIIFTIDPNGTILFINKAVEVITGFKVSEMTGKNIAAFLEPFELAEVNADLELLQTVVLPPKDYQMQSKSGGTIWLRVSSKIKVNEYNELNITGIAQDVTKQKKIELAHEASEKRLRHLVENLNVGLVVHNADTSILVCNNKASELLGISSDESLGRRFDDPDWYFIDENFQRLTPEEYPVYQVLKSGKPLVSFTGAIVKPNSGETVWVLVHAYPEFDATGKLTQIVVTFIDISELKFAQDKLRESEEKWKTIIKTSPDGICIASTEGTILYVSDKLVKWHGYEQASEMTGKSITDFIVPELLQDSKEKLGELVNGKPLGIVEYELLKKDGSRFFAEISSEILLDKNGQPEAVFLIERDITDKVKTRAQLTLLSKAIEQSPASVIITDSKGMIEYVNPKHLEKTGSLLEKLTGTSLNRHLASPLNTDLAIQIESHLNKGMDWHGEIAHHNSNGEIIWEFAVISAIKDQKGNVTNYLAMLEDITTLKVAEKTLKESELKLKLALSVANMGYWRFEEATNRVEWSEGHEKLFGIEMKDFKENYDAVQEILHPDDRFYVAENLRKALENNINFDNHYRVIHPGGEIRWLYSYGIVINQDNPGQKEVFGITQDITKIKQYELKLEMENRFKQLLLEIASNYINLPLSKIDEETNRYLGLMSEFVKADRAYTFEYLWKEGICTNTFEWCRPGIEPHIENLRSVPLGMMEDWVKVHKAGEVMSIESVDQLPPIPEKEILASQGIRSVLSVPMMNNGECIGFVGFDFVNDQHKITDTEQQLLVLYAQVLVNIKLRARSESEINMAKLRAEASDKLKTTFINTIHHEIRTPLNGIRGFGELMTNPDFTLTDRQEHYKEIKSSTDRLIQTMTDYMDISKIATGNMEINKVDMNLKTMIEESAGYLKELCKHKDIEIALDLPECKPGFSIVADRELVGKAIRHLMSNAEKFTTSGKIIFGCEPTANGVRFFVKDSGKGIEAHKINLIFEAFMKEDFTIARGYEGSGLGLAIVKGVVDLHGGELGAESEVGKGSTFWFFIPSLLKNYAGAGQPAKLREVVISEKPVILIAEDTDANFQLMNILLSKAGYHILHAFNGLRSSEHVQKTS